MKCIKYLKNLAPYKEGDIAGADDEVAEKLIADGIAVEYEASAPAEPETKSVDSAPEDKMMDGAPEKKTEPEA